MRRIPLQKAKQGQSRAVEPQQQYAYHVTNAAMLKKFQRSGGINSPVNLYVYFEDAIKMKRENHGRSIILKCPVTKTCFRDPLKVRKAVLISPDFIPLSECEEVG